MNNACGYKPPRRPRAQFIINHVKIDKLCVLRKHVGCIVQWCMPLFMQEHQQDVYNSIHTGNTQYFVPIHIYIEHTRIGPVCVSIHASRAQGVLHVCPYSYVQDTHKMCYVPISMHRRKGLVMCI